MPLTFRTYHRRERRGRRWLSVAAVAFVLFCAAAYFYGSHLRIDLRMNKGWSFFQQRNYEQALGEFNQVLKLQANYPQAIDAIGLIYLSQGDLVRAEIKYEQAMKHGLKSNRRSNHTKIGYTFLDQGIYPPAELSFRHALELAPKDAQAYLGYALSLHALGRLSEAIDAYRKTLALNSELDLAQQKLNQARQDLERGFTYYMYDRQNYPLARIPLAPKPGIRYYPLSQYASHLIGYVSAEHGSAGLERAFANYLPGNVITLTIDNQWQRAADAAMGWRKGSLVAINPKTGEIMALVNHPSFNPNRIDEDWDKIVRNKNQPLKNRALESLYTPGSIFKMIPASAAVETQLNLNRIFPVYCAGSVRYEDQAFWCWRRHGRVDSLQAALDTSCNVGLAEVGFALGPDRLYEYSNRYGFGVPINFAFKSATMEFTLPVATSIAPMVEGTHYAMAERSCGLGDDIFITPLHAALLAATIANQGRMMSPYFIKDIKNIRGDVLASGVPQVMRTPVQPEVADKIRSFMIDTVKHGIGTKAQLPNITVAGKTGTTGDSRRGLNGWFICFAPAENPQVAVAVYAEKEGTGMDVAAPIARRFLETALSKPKLEAPDAR